LPHCRTMRLNKSSSNSLRGCQTPVSVSGGYSTRTHTPISWRTGVRNAPVIQCQHESMARSRQYTTHTQQRSGARSPTSSHGTDPAVLTASLAVARICRSLLSFAGYHAHLPTLLLDRRARRAAPPCQSNHAPCPDRHLARKTS
jgi:hypothetical protein